MVVIGMRNLWSAVGQSQNKREKVVNYLLMDDIDTGNNCSLNAQSPSSIN